MRDNMVERAEIQDLLVNQEDVLFVQGALDFYDNTENRIAARESIANYVNQMMVEYSLSIKDVRHIMKTLNRYIQSNDSF